MRAIKQTVVCGRTVPGLLLSRTADSLEVQGLKTGGPVPEHSAVILIPGCSFADGISYTVPECVEDMEYLQDLVGPSGQMTGPDRTGKGPGRKSGDGAHVSDEGILVLTDRSVYGKVFGTPHKLKEEELGYCGHVRPDGETGLAMRMLEDFCVRLSRESAVPIRVGRCALSALTRNLWPAGEQGGHGKKISGDNPALRQLENVLQNGDSGEIFNLEPEPVAADPSAPEGEMRTGQITDGMPGYSPLSPVPIVLNTEKADALEERVNGKHEE